MLYNSLLHAIETNFSFAYSSSLWQFIISLNSIVKTIEFFTCITSFLFFMLFLGFYLANTVFFRILFFLLITVNAASIVIHLGGDFFAGFLIVAELPVVLISLLFYFHKYALQVDTLFTFTISNNKKVLAYYSIIFLGFFYDFILLANFTNHTLFNQPSTFYLNTFYMYTLSNSFLLSTRNDFFLYFTVYYVINSFLVGVLAFLLFFVSCLCIFIFFTLKKSTKLNEQVKENTIFLRKQSMLRQGFFSTKLKFFKKKKGIQTHPVLDYPCVPKS